MLIEPFLGAVLALVSSFLWTTATPEDRSKLTNKLMFAGILLIILVFVRLGDINTNIVENTTEITQSIEGNK